MTELRQTKPRVRVLLINPNTSEAATTLMLRIAREAAGPDIDVVGITAPFGNTLITNEEKLAVAGNAVIAVVEGLPLPLPDGIVIAAFGDPGLETVRRLTSSHVVGLAEASMIEASEHGRSFSVATTTPDLTAAIRRCAERYGVHAQFRSVRTTRGEPATVMEDDDRLLRVLEKVAGDIIEQDGAQAIIIGGGPLAGVARKLAETVPIAVIEPIPAAIRLLRSKCEGRA
jgi:allantoin racemase